MSENTRILRTILEKVKAMSVEDYEEFYESVKNVEDIHVIADEYEISISMNKLSGEASIRYDRIITSPISFRTEEESLDLGYGIAKAA